MRARRRGFALALILISTSGLFAIGAQQGVATRAALVEAQAILAQDQARRSARAAAALAIRAMLGERRDAPETPAAGATTPTPQNRRDAPEEEIELPPIIREILGEMVGEIESGARNTRSDGANSRVSRERPWQAPALPARGIEMQLPEDPNRCRVTLRDAAGQLNLNTIAPERFEIFLIAHGVAPSRARSIAHELHDWIDEDGFVRERGAERDAHARRGVTCANRPMVTARELLYLPSMTPDLYDRIRNDLSVEGDGRIHLPTASREALLTLPGFSSEIVAVILARRERGPISRSQLEDMLPIAARGAFDHLRLDSSPFIRVEAEVISPSGAVRHFRGLATLTRRGLGSLHLLDE